MILGLGDRLGHTISVRIVLAKIVERYFDFFLSYLVALEEDVSGVSLEDGHWSAVPCPGTFGGPFAMPAING